MKTIGVHELIAEKDATGKDGATWGNLNRIASELEPYWPKGVDAVDIVRDVRRNL